MMRSLCALVVVALIGLCAACYSNGICGGGAPCGYPPPPPPSCACPRSYGCGSYGCYRHRARSSKTFVPQRSRNVLEHDRAILRKKLAKKARSASAEVLEGVSDTAASLTRSKSGRLVNPNKAFLECCMDRHLPDACLQKCNFGAYNKDTLTRMYFKQDACPLAAMAEMQFCAAMGRDHSECCARNGVTTTLAGPKCLTFCDQRPGKYSKIVDNFLKNAMLKLFITRLQVDQRLSISLMCHALIVSKA